MIRLILRALFWVGMIFFILTFVRDSTLPLGDRWTAVGVIVRDEQFDYVSWEISALAAKVGQTLFGVHPFMSEEGRAGFVRAYMNDLTEARALEAQVNAIYTDPNVGDPAAESGALRERRDALRVDLDARQTLAEAILEGQVAAVLVDQGFGVGGQLLPPIAMRFSRVPNVLVVSPRDAIRFDVSINLDPMPVDAIAALEDAIDAELDVSSLIEPIGGIALYPAMILETTSIPFALETFVHEWLHHYLYAFPLGLDYDFAGEARIINETTANLFGEEVGRIVLEHYYPDLAAPSAATAIRLAKSEAESLAAQDRFDFGAALHETRVTVDQLLAEGRVEEAEAYMEERRRLFVENGYGIRKLNQAYFAFYGGYQSGAPGAGGSDPIGPAIQAIRDASPSIHDWIVTMRGITTREELLAARDAALAG